MWYCLLLYKVVPTFKSVDETLVYDHSNESYWAVLSCGAVYYAAQGGSLDETPLGLELSVWPFKCKLLSNISCGTVCLLCYARWFYHLSLWILKPYGCESIKWKQNWAIQQINLRRASRADEIHDKRVGERTLSANLKTGNVENYQMCFLGKALIRVDR